MKKTILALIVFTFWSTAAFCGVTASVQNQNIAVDQPFTYTISSDNPNAGKPDLSVLSGLFEVVSTSFSQKNYIVNGKSSSQKIWHFGLVSKKSGDITIPSISLGSEQTNPVSIFVSNDASSFVSQNDQNPSSKQTSTPLYRLSAKLENTPSTPFIQQQLTYIVTLTDDGHLQGDAPYFDVTDDFIIRSLGEPSVSNTQDGKRLLSFPFALFAQKSGKLKLPNIKFDGVSYQTPDTANFFDAGFFQIRLPSIFGVQTPVNLTFEGPQIEIKPVPSGYTGAWWLPADNVTLSSNFKQLPQNLTENSPLTLEVTLKAEGLTDTQLPELSFPLSENFRIYPEKPVSSNILQGHKIIAEQKTLVTYIPQKSGDLTLPEISVQWFNTKTQKLEKAVLGEIKLHVLPSAQSSLSNQKQQHTSKENLFSKDEHFNVYGFYIGIILSFVCGIFLSVFVLKIKGQSSSNIQKNNNIKNPKKTEKNELKQLRNDIISKVQTAYPNFLITNLDDVAELLADDEFKKEINAFLNALYAPEKNKLFDTKRFTKLFNHAFKNRQKNIKKNTPIPPLYEP